MSDYKNVFSPFRVGNVEIKNRIEVPPMLACMASADGYVTRELIEFYQGFARGGAGIVTIGDAAIDFDYAPGHLGQLNLGTDKAIAGLSVLAEAIKKHGAKISIEVNHSGRLASPVALNGKNPIGPSMFTMESPEPEFPGEKPKKIQVDKMNQEMIDQVIDHYAGACYRCLKAGFDMVMLHGAHGHLLAQFVSGYTNKRTDNYGGSLENRARFVIETLQAVRQKVGNRLAIEYRISADELVPDGMHEQETIEFVKLIQDKIDLLHVSVGMVGNPKSGPYTIQPTYFPLAMNVPRAERIKKVVQIPVTCVGSIVDLDMAERIIAEGKADIVAMGRAQIADPEIVNKTYYGELQNIRPCVRCISCSERVKNFFPPRCAVNPVIGREIEYKYIRPAEKKKKVVIVGGGPAGMEAALIASSRGHRVALFEKEAELGGMLRYAAAPPFKSDMKKYLDWLIKTTRNSSIELHLKTEVTADLLNNAKPEVLVIAAGAEPFTPDIPGIKNSNVVWAGDVDMGNATTGQNTVVAGAGLTGCETALNLAQQGKNVTVIDMICQSEVARDASSASRAGLMELLEQYQVKFRTEVKLEEINYEGAIVIDKGWNRFIIPADSVVLSLGMIARPERFNSFKGLAREAYTIGDCRNPGNLLAAIHDAFNIAVKI
jgi:2,4-dienoyl-CoA reductase-like NADH-dependent reductase (Old Yellow Enzyme family)/thioredoxin reductase